MEFIINITLTLIALFVMVMILFIASIYFLALLGWMFTSSITIRKREKEAAKDKKEYEVYECFKRVQAYNDGKSERAEYKAKLKGEQQ